MNHRSIVFSQWKKGFHQLFWGGLICFVILSFLPTSLYAANNDPFRSGRDVINPKSSISVGQSSGAMTYTYPLSIPPGRNGMQPDLSFNYSSADKRTDSLNGYGWSLSIPYIERVNKTGTNNLYNQDAAHTYFISSLSGEILPVKNTTPTGGSFLGLSLSTDALPTVDSPGVTLSAIDVNAEQILPPREQDTLLNVNPATVSLDIARTFHTFTDTFLPIFQYHPNDQKDFQKHRDQGALEAKEAISGFTINTGTQDVEVVRDERATTKGAIIASIGAIEKTKVGDISVEVIRMSAIDNGVEVFARAWNTNDKQLGFGKDGSVEIERFRIFNPPILVDDQHGDIVRTWRDQSGKEQIYTLREDPKEALLQVLAHVIGVKQEKFVSSNIVTGKIGNTTDTYYPDAGTGATTVDGYTRRGPVAESWSTIRDAASAGDVGTSETSAAITEVGADSGSNLWRGITRGHFLFNTASIPDGDTVSSATFSLYIPSYGNGTNITNDLAIVTTNPASSNTLTGNDYATLGTTLQSDTVLSSASISLNAYNNFSLNTTGISNISKTGITKLGTRNSTHDRLNSMPTWSSGFPQSYISSRLADQTGTANDPVLVVEHGVNGVAMVSDLQLESLTNPSNIATSNPRFSAIHNNASTTALAVSYQIQVSSSTLFTSSLFWDSGKKTLSSTTPRSQRTPQIYSTTTFPMDGSQFYWRMRLWDQLGTAGEWSTTTNLWVTQITGDYMAKVDDGSMMKYTLNADGSWVAYDKRGLKYTFGASANSRISDPSASSKIYRWYLDEITDPHNNRILYRYTKDGGQVYPDYIYYTDHSGGSLYDIDFTIDYCDSTGYPCAPFATSSMYGFPIFTRYLVSDITVAVNGPVLHRITPRYTTGDNGSRILLESIKETTYNDSGVFGSASLPLTTFRYQPSTTTWTQTTDVNSWQVGFDVSDTSNNDYGWRLFDANGDALPDWLRSDGSTKTVLLNTGSKWSTSTAWTIPVNFSSGNLEQGVRMAEVNGDGLIDIVSASSTKIVYLNNGTSTWVASTTWQFPFSFIDSGNRDQGVQLADVNGDGLTDVIRSYYASTTGTTTSIYTNTGFGWAEDSGWTIPEVLINDLKDSAVRLNDYNGDGLVDLLYSPYPSGTTRVYYNTGRGWQLDASALLPFRFAETSASIGSADRGVRFADINSDGCVDVVQGMTSLTKDIRMSNCGDGWDVVVQNTLPEYFRDSASDYGVRTEDINGDGLLDIVRGYYDSSSGVRTRKVYLKNGEVPDLLREVSTPLGGRTTVGYKGSPEYRDGSGALMNPMFPMILQTVQSVATDNGSFLTTNRILATTTYDYSRGYFYGTGTNPLNRQFGGFSLVVASTTPFSTTKTYFHQGYDTDSANGEFGDHISKAGKPYRVETYDMSGNLFSRIINKWARADYGDGRNFVKLAQTLSQTFDGDTSHRDTAASTTYNDTTGGISVSVNYGEVIGNSDGTFTDIGSDGASTTYSYAASSTNVTMSLPARELLVDQSGNTMKDTKWYYDDLTSGYASLGNRTKEEHLVSGARYSSSTWTYDTYGHVSTSTDPVGNKTTYVYDGYNLFPVTIINAKNQRKYMSYDYSSGKVATTTYENNQTFVTVFDNFDRPKEEKQPDFTAPSTLVFKTSYTYSDSTTTPSSVFRRDYLSSATTTDSYVYVDGFGRTIQVKREAESANGWVTKDTLYNILGSIDQESLPYFSASSAYGAPTTTPALFTAYTYDATGRVKTTANAVGTTTNTYQDWRLTVTDPLANKKEYNKDAYGNLASVVEYPGSGATTTYTWNLLGKLIKITDSVSNLRNFTYDLLGRLTGSEDLHASGDTAYGTTSRQYDDAGNVIQVYTPKGNSITYTYDALNRVTKEDATTTATGLTDVVYRYDSCTNGVGRLCQVNANNAATTTYVYNPIGLVSTEGRQIASTWATTSTTYLRNGALDTITYPDSRQIAYVYNDAGDPNRVLGLAPASTTWQTIVESITYAPTGQPSVIDYGNNTKTLYIYDQGALYRLLRKLTIATSTSPSIAERLLLLGNTFTAPKLQLLAETLEEIIQPLSPFVASTTDIIPSETLVDFETATETDPLDIPDTTVINEAFETTPFIIDDLSTTTLSIDPDQSSDIIFDTEAHATEKGERIAALRYIPPTQFGEYTLEITSTNAIPGGVEVFVRAWDNKTEQIGFGLDGSVDIERFRIFNPPILIDDPEGDIVRTWKTPEGEEQSYRLREDPQTALLYVLASAMDVKKEKYENSHIISGKVGNTTSIFYPSAGTGGSSVDGYTRRAPVTESWSTIHDASGATDSASADSTATISEVMAQTTTNTWRAITRSHFLFNTAAIPDGDTVSSATFSLYIPSYSTHANITNDVAIVSTNPSATSSLTDTDYATQGTTLLSNTVLNSSGITLNSYHNFSLNATGLSSVSKTGLTKLGTRNSTHDRLNSAPTWAPSYAWSYIQARFADDTGTTNDPMLVVEHSGSGGTPAVATTTLQDLNYTYDAVGNILSIIDQSGTKSYASTSYQYDNLYRLTRASTTNATTTNWLQTYSYNDIGNLLTKSDVGSYSYAGTGYINPHAPTTINGITYSYDNAGNLTQYGTSYLFWNYRNRLTDSNIGGTTTKYSYDHLDQRVLLENKIGAGSTSTTRYWNKYFQKEGATTTAYVYLPTGELLATIEGNGLSTSTYITHTDHLNSATIQTDNNGALVQLTELYPYGSIRSNDRPANYDSDRKFLSQYSDPVFSYLNARYYEGQNGQFLSQDPVARDVGMMQKMPAYLLIINQSAGTIDQNLLLSNPQMLNSYSYSVNNPVNISDPSGKNPFLLAGGAAFMASVSWNLGNDFSQNFQDIRAGNLPWYMLTQARGENPGGRYFKDASTAAVVTMGAVGAEMAAPVLLPGITLGGAQVIGATAGGLGNVGVTLINGGARNPNTGNVNTVGLATDFATGFIGARIGQQIPNPVGRPPTTVTGSLGGARVATEQLRAQLGQLVQALSAYIATLSAQKATK